MIREAIARVVEGDDLSEGTMIDVMDMVMGGEATAAQIASFITALRMKGETIEEITGAARVMRQRATPIRVGKVVDIDREEINVDQETILDTCGTGGSGTKSFNISTTVALVVSACGVKVAKHGNRSISSACGSADVLEALGVNLEVSAETVESCIDEIGVGFLYAPALHGAMKHAIGPRKEIGIRTIFNVLGPLTNPAGADRQVLGVYRESLVDALARVLVNLGCRRGYVVHGMDGMDEVTLTGPTRVAEIRDGEVTLSTIEPEDFGFTRCQLSDLQGG
ncbi:MAG: anthranilate phosphoribosyltransferase, partial [Desulfuromonadales bacterium]|nr:anthranilate phosphoribosyltransferase [Desulfuromonadales bacterium]